MAIEIVTKKAVGFGRPKTEHPAVAAYRTPEGTLRMSISIPDASAQVGGIKEGDRASFFIDKEVTSFGFVVHPEGAVKVVKTSKAGTTLVIRGAISKEHEEYVLGHAWKLNCFSDSQSGRLANFLGSEGTTEVKSKKPS